MIRFNYIKGALALMLAGTLFSTSCTKTEYVKDPNNPTVESVLQNATKVQINQLGVGVQSVMRNGHFAFWAWGGSIGREGVYFAATESRYYRELQGSIPIDPAGIMYDWWFSFNQTRRRAEILLQSAQNTANLTDAEKNAVVGFAKTVQAYVMLNCLNMAGTQGIRTTYTDLLAPGDLLKPGCFKTYEESLAYVKQLADEGAAALDAAGGSFPFTMTTGWASRGFTTPAEFKTFNRAVAARIAMYGEDWAGLEAALNQSYLDLDGNLNAGPVFTYSTTPGDALNPMFSPKDEPNRPLLVQVNFPAEAEAGDDRVFGPSTIDGGVAKIRRRTTPSAPPDYPVMEFEVQMYATQTTPIGIIRNEELILMYAEAKLKQGQLTAAKDALDIIRNAHGLADYGGAVTEPALTDELLKQRRYSLYFEGHRWFDMRRYGRLNQLPLDIPATHQVWTEFPRHKQELDWDSKYDCE